MQDLTKVRNVHRLSLKPRVQRDAVPTESLKDWPELPVPSVREEDLEEMEDGDLALVVTQAPSAIPESIEVNRAPPEVRVSPMAPGGAVGGSERSVSLPVDLGSGSIGPSSISERIVRPRRARAGQHTNLHHLPRAVGAEAHQISARSTSGLNRAMAWFRP